MLVAKALLKYNIGSCRLDNKRANDMVGELILHRPIVEWENVCYNDIVEYFQQLKKGAANMTIQQLQYILEVQRTSSVTKAAKKLFVTPSSVSCAIAALEKELGTNLFQRSCRGVVPTEDGLRVLQCARNICEQHRLMQGKEERVGNMVCIETGRYYPLSRAFAKISEECMGSGVALSHRTSSNHGEDRDRLSRGETDLVVFLKPCVRPHAPNIVLKQKNLIWTIRKELPYVIRIGPGHRLYHKENLVPEDFNGDVMIDTPDALVVKSRLLNSFVNVDPEQVVLESDRTTRFDMLRRGVGFMPGTKFPEELDRQYGFRNVYLDGLYYALVSVVNADLPVRPEVTRYLQLLDEELSTI